MTNEPRHLCVYAMSSLKKNSTRLLVVMCIGIALGAYGIYVQARSHSNVSYVPSITMATRWMAERVGYKMMHPSQMMKACGMAKGAANMAKHSGGLCHFMMRFLVNPIVSNSGMMNLMINVAQIILLKVYCRSIMATDVMIAMSVLGLIISMICMFGSFATCKLMCISCLGLQHMAIIYFSFCRRKILQNMLCGISNNQSSFGSRACPSGSNNSTSSNVASSSSSSSSKKKPEKYSS